MDRTESYLMRTGMGSREKRLTQLNLELDLSDTDVRGWYCQGRSTVMRLPAGTGKG